jgi:hypothetical protein
MFVEINGDFILLVRDIVPTDDPVELAAKPFSFVVACGRGSIQRTQTS